MEHPHQFTPPGWYHAGFLVAATTLIGCLLGLLIPRLRTAQRLPYDRLLACSAVGFALLLSADLLFPAGPERHHVAPGGVVSVTATVAVTVAALVAVRPRGADRDRRVHLRECAFGAVLALAVVGFSVPWETTAPFVWVAASAAVAALFRAERRNGTTGVSKRG
ncbi:hypothetical protein ACFYNZ_16840 [Streptomyces kebangsaanensis]|uniref:DUF998 domain-containing protein n=1 Tax=Streptomyces kebangsaanensis TaxID=864058 RepID=A0ABW6KTE3_9ACTN